jgi:hypothetical protein
LSAASLAVLSVIAREGTAGIKCFARGPAGGWIGGARLALQAMQRGTWVWKILDRAEERFRVPSVTAHGSGVMQTEGSFSQESAITHGRITVEAYVIVVEMWREQ